MCNSKIDLKQQLTYRLDGEIARKNMKYIYKVYYKGELQRFFERRWEAEKYIEKRNNNYTLVVEEIE